MIAHSIISPLCYAVFQGVMYEFSYLNRTCIKKPLDIDFQPLRVPENASLIGQAVLGASSGFGQGVLVNSWTGELPIGSEKGMLRIISAAEETKMKT